MPNFSANTAFIIVDVQQGFANADYWGPRNNPQAEANIATLLAAWRKTARPIFHIKHNSTFPQSPLRPGQPGNDFHPLVAPITGEPIIEKTVNSAFIGTDLEQRLRQQGISELVIVGLTTNHCVSTTVRMAGNLGFITTIVHDATATFDRVGVDGKRYPAQLIHDTAIASLHDEFATALTTQAVLTAIQQA